MIDMVVSLNNTGPQYRPQNTTVLIGTPKMVSGIHNFGRPHMEDLVACRAVRWPICCYLRDKL